MKILCLITGLGKFFLLLVHLYFSHTSVQALGFEAAVRAPDVEQLAQFPEIGWFRISPDGKILIAIESSGDSRNILVWKMKDLAAKPTVIGSDHMQIQSAEFLKNDMLAVKLLQPFDHRFLGSLEKTFVSKLFVTDLEGKKWLDPMANASIVRDDTSKLLSFLTEPTIVSMMPNDPDHVILQYGLLADKGLYRYSLRSGVATRIMYLSDKDIEVKVSATGTPWAKTRLGKDGDGGFIAIDFRTPEGHWDEHFRNYIKDHNEINVIAQGAKPDSAIIKSNVNQELTSIYTYDIRAKKIVAKLYEHDFFNAIGLGKLGNRDEADNERSGDDKSTDFDYYKYEGPYGADMHVENAELAAAIQTLVRALGIKQTTQQVMSVSGARQGELLMLDGVNVSLAGVVKGEATYLFIVSGAAYPPEYYLLKDNKILLLGKAYPAIDRAALGTTRFLYYRARDGFMIPAYLSVPNEKLCGSGPYSAVVHPHGGPWARDHMDFDSSNWVNMMVSQCRVVLRPQFRGSLGWGRTLWQAGDAEWGKKMQDDKDDGAKWLITEKYADPARIAIFGFSYGGYAAFVAAIRPNGLYKCAIAGAGVSDIEKIMVSFYLNPIFRERQEETIKGLNPVAQADKIKIPIMVYTGDRDTTVPPQQSEMFVNRAKAAGKPVQYHVIKDFAHGPAWKRENAIEHLALISNYLKRGCGSGGL
jgi:hypothetical protein